MISKPKLPKTYDTKPEQSNPVGEAPELKYGVPRKVFAKEIILST
jgi:hypothetical protein